MRLQVKARFATVLVVRGDLIPMAADAGTVLELDEETALALLRDLPGVVVEDKPPKPPEPITAAPVETVEVPEELVEPEPKPKAKPKAKARTRQVAKPPARKKRG